MKKILFLFIVMSLLLFVPELYGAVRRFDLGLSEQFCQTMPPAIIQSAYMGDRYRSPDISGGDNNPLNVVATLSLRKKIAPVNLTTPTKNLLVKDRCDSLAYQNVDIGPATAEGQNWFTRFWVRTDYLTERTFPAGIGHDEFVWTVKESKFNRSKIDMVVTCQFPISGYVHSRLAGGSWMLGPQITVSWGKPRK